VLRERAGDERIDVIRTETDAGKSIRHTNAGA
jgi:hypothetical protein